MIMEEKKSYDSYLTEDNLIFIENEYIKLGANLSIGGALTYLCEHGRKNLINSYDWGRQVQMSFYGYPLLHTPEGYGRNKSWDYIGWNPIQSGDCFRNRADILDYYCKENEIYVKSVPRHWPLDNCKGECTFETWYRLDGKNVNVTARINNNRTDKTLYGARGQELPAVYTNGEWYKLVSYLGDNPFTNDTLTEICNKENGLGWPWEYFCTSESWVALVDDDNYGLGVYNGQTSNFAGGFAGGEKGIGGPKDRNTGYITPMANEILDWNIVYTYNYSLIVGDLESIRATAYEMDKKADRLSYNFEKDRDHFYYRNTTDKGIGNQDCLDFDIVPESELVSPRVFIDPKKSKKIVLDAIFEGGEISGKVRVWVYEVGMNKKKNYVTRDFKLLGDGERKQHEIDISGFETCFAGFSLVFEGEGHAKVYSAKII